MRLLRRSPNILTPAFCINGGARCSIPAQLRFLTGKNAKINTHRGAAKYEIRVLGSLPLYHQPPPPPDPRDWRSYRYNINQYFDVLYVDTCKLRCYNGIYYLKIALSLGRKSYTNTKLGEPNKNRSDIF